MSMTIQVIGIEYKLIQKTLVKLFMLLCFHTFHTFHAFYAILLYYQLLPSMYHFSLQKFPANISLDADLLKTSSRSLLSWHSKAAVRISLRRLDQDEYICLSRTSSEDNFKTC